MINCDLSDVFFGDRIAELEDTRGEKSTDFSLGIIFAFLINILININQPI